MKIKGAIFDMDGTLVDSMFMWYELGNLYLKKRGKTPEPGLYDMLTRMTMLEAAQFLKDNMDLRRHRKNWYGIFIR